MGIAMISSVTFSTIYLLCGGVIIFIASYRIQNRYQMDPRGRAAPLGDRLSSVAIYWRPTVHVYTQDAFVMGTDTTADSHWHWDQSPIFLEKCRTTLASCPTIKINEKERS